MKIQYKTRLYGWKDVSECTAKRIAFQMYNGITTMKPSERVNYINSRFNGIRFIVYDFTMAKNIERIRKSKRSVANDD